MNGMNAVFPFSLSSAKVPDMLRLSSATAAAAAATATLTPIPPRNETLPAAAPRLGLAAENDAGPAAAVDAEAALSANAMGGGGWWLRPLSCLVCAHAGCSTPCSCGVEG
uniref:Uncharacterized protein n=1 Tax=Arundo donax TaxID=35708 RepID=A0A0A9GP94_ARUDO